MSFALPFTRPCGRSLAAAVAFAALQAFGAAAADPSTLRIGVLTYQGPETVQEDWSGVKSWLAAYLPGHHFAVLDFDQAGLTRAVQARDVDFAITSSSHYAALEHGGGANRIATLDSPWALSPSQSLGSVILVRSDSGLRTLADLSGKRVLAVGADAFAGYQIAAGEMLRAGVDPERDLVRLQFMGFPVRRIAHAVQAGRADAGIVRTCLLEQMVRDGEIGAAALRVLAPIDTRGFKCQSSSRLYPDWPFVALPHVPKELSRAIAMALLAMPATPNGYSWAIAADYQVVGELLRDLKTGPYAYLREWTFETIVRRNWGWILLILALLVAGAMHTVRVEHLVNQRTRALRAAQEEQRRMEEQARAHQTTLDHTARLAILGEMASAIAHELNQPLAAIGNFARGMARRITAGRMEPQPLLDGTGEIVTQSERAASIIRHIRALSQKRPTEQKPVDLKAVVGETIGMFAGTHPQTQVIWQPTATPGPATVMADPVQIQQVVLNLLKNALDAQQTVDRADEPIEVTFRTEAGNGVITVRDHGCGLAPGQFAHLFEPFFTTKPEGLGLGLSLSKGIIESLGGTLAVAPNDGQPGLAIEFGLPLETSAEEL